LLPVAAVLTYGSVPLDGLGDSPYVAGFLVFSIGGGILVGYTRIRHLEGYFLAGIAVAYVGSILAALCIAPSTCPTCRSYA
jgi:nucleoside permease NupC